MKIWQYLPDDPTRKHGTVDTTGNLWYFVFKIERDDGMLTEKRRFADGSINIVEYPASCMSEKLVYEKGKGT